MGAHSDGNQIRAQRVAEGGVEPTEDAGALNGFEVPQSRTRRSSPPAGSAPVSQTPRRRARRCARRRHGGDPEFSRPRGCWYLSEDWLAPPVKAYAGLAGSPVQEFPAASEQFGL